MITPDEMQFYANHLLRYWLREQQRQGNSSARDSPRPQQAASNSRTPVTPITPGPSFGPSPSTSYPVSSMSSSSTIYHQPQYPEPMEGVQPTNPTPSQPHNPSPQTQ